ncbi:RcpC/CpaB family pilus assembly protein [Streptomyces sp. BR1]|uniref:RcpC/CpaB family pilus assembly protein n=1 Tax=Streptomyces sp. BR1 TaxID=1592323 RepID=UPI00402B1FDB
MSMPPALPTPSPAHSAAPEPLGVPAFPPLRVRGGRHRLRRAVRRRRRAMAAGLAVAAAALAATGAGGPGRAAPRVSDTANTASTGVHQQAAPRQPAHQAVEVVSAPVRIADAETVRLLRPGDRVDVIASPDSRSGGGGGGAARVVASGVRVTDVPRPHDPSPDGGALIILSVPRATATTLVGAGASARLAVTLR